MIQNGIFPSKIDDSIDVTLERWALNAVRRKQLLPLARIVKLLHEEVGDGVMR